MRSYMQILQKFAKFIGPGILVSVAYMDPGNYATSVSGGAQYKYTLLFSIFISNIFAVLLQCLCVKLGTITGYDLAENCRHNLPKKLNYTLYLFAEVAIIATDLAEVVGTAIALQILFKIPLTWGVLLTVLDVLVILMFYTPNGQSLKKVRVFEFGVGILVIGTCICFVLELFKVSIPDKAELFKGFLPSNIIFKEQQALYISLGILGATVMPHSLYLGSSIVKPRLHDYDLKKYGKVNARPSLSAIKYTLNYAYAELIISLFLIATFVNSAILIVAGATLSGQPEAEDADLLSIYKLLVHYISPAAGLIFALAMLCSGQSAGIICTLAGQIVSEGFLQWSLPPWATRLCTRLIAIVPCLFVTLTMGEKGISDILNFSQVVLSLILPIVSAPLIYFTANRKLMVVHDENGVVRAPADVNAIADETTPLNSKHSKIVDFTNSRLLTYTSVFVWALIGSLNCYLVISYLLGADIHF
ncbi:AQG_2a_G0035830.mRNA.1.CDS.1 [Saccharomyces cerevisiae]|uniref:Iron transporter SMF3 n=6 Tax=Saccharomyces cerevisiae TaxID=4932 RepID=SMF3_YEAST|nr:putative divalent metal ion transporter SMF3 [Saccharomyces cerevisiae S288C]Q12078.1 RecName: Full=Iron transporter SMF3 [Saccharomyces cerevisiae S288C]AAA77056.1 transmembrane protein [Saccharomyces cerevisiae]AHY78439.1 Smf3p [Saccharomyces cerevisiae YJM993]AJP40219.1 Smf3p [Saccharomyces cerevisiae YJM1078]AJV46572.1 Smf3p [Saccharomyces cerevisiae YJM1129]AJV47022.1 Smf3p [Saccharomyces cerevisiae YJM1133]AJV47477.1 Smf3p [Saccharomyces cerevisiae YJM1190]AJV47928.1 Smf3p [Sacchar|eukprot:NP_013134.1 putative divalent metal ion transporter SMF3 [Saccharomyces cerevisiae S288C]